jgi:colanic acid/amylovoran biosynthesis glycosyltransferase
MKIGYLISEYPAVSHAFIRREVAALRQRGIEIDTFSIRAPVDRHWMSSEDAAALESTYYVLPVKKAKLLWIHLASCVRHPMRYIKALGAAYRHRPPGIRGAVYALFYFIEAIYLSKELKRRDIRHLHNHFGNSAGTVCLLASCFLGIPWSFTIHGSSGFEYPAGLLLSEKIRSASFTVCISCFVRAQAQRFVEPDNWHKLIISRCGVNMTEMPPVGATGVGAPKLRILSVGRLSPIKAFAGLIEAFADVKKRSSNVELRIIGEGPERKAIERQIQRLGLSDSCFLLGCKSGADVLREMADSDIFAMSSLMEGLPVVIMEALAVGVPVVAPCVAGIPELVEHEQSGLLYVVSSWSGLANCIERLIADPELRARMGRNGHQRVVQEYSIDHAVAPIAERFAGLTETSSS